MQNEIDAVSVVPNYAAEVKFSTDDGLRRIMRTAMIGLIKFALSEGQADMAFS